MSATASVQGIELVWLPGCPYCIKLRAGLRLRRIPTTDINITESPADAARVRAVADGNETCPTLFIGGDALVNPSVQQVIATVRRVLPERADDLVGDAEKFGLLTRLRTSSRRRTA